MSELDDIADLLTPRHERVRDELRELRAENERLRADLAGLAAAGDMTKRVYCARLEEVEDALVEACGLLAIYDHAHEHDNAVPVFTISDARAFRAKWGRK